MTLRRVPRAGQMSLDALITGVVLIIVAAAAYALCVGRLGEYLITLDGAARSPLL